MPVDVVTSTLREWGRDNGFVRKGTTLYRDQPETLAVVNLQGSQWGGRKYVNIALWLKAVGEPGQPRKNVCHIRTRLSQLVDDPEVVDRLLSVEASLQDAALGSRLRAVLDASVTPVLAKTGTVAELRANRPGFLDRFLLGQDALPLLDEGIAAAPE
jgi:hypothetical protein